MVLGRKPSQKNTNGWDVLIRFIDVTYNLINSGNFLCVLIFLGFAYVFYITYRLPAESIDSYIQTLGAFLASERYYFFPVGTAFIVSLYGNYIQKRIYKQEIRRLTDERAFLMHGLSKGELDKLKEHHPSNFDLETPE